ncbi:TauD/TfdA family dioxygenase [Salinarimonas sp. NSM]|uniref:TauD/TfdA family dioxygenase n=1 Tax=Salinarimonas sp. NSM TaxID=3458003 RepID=UPI0040354BC7
MTHTSWTQPLHLHLDDRTRDRLATCLRDIVYPAAGFEAYVETIRAAFAPLTDVFAPVRAFLDEGTPADRRPGAIKITNLPLSTAIPKPPLDASALTRIDKPDYLSENLLTAIASLFGEPYSMHCEGRGLVNNLIPTRTTSEQITGLGASSDLRFHAENAALRFLTERDCAPAALFLLGVAQEPTPPRTRLSDARAALALVDSADRELLAQPLYAIKLPYRWRGYRPGYDTLSTRLVPLVEEDERGLVVHAAFYGDMIAHVVDAAAERAARAFEAALEEVSHDVIVSPGELIGIDNRTTLYARTPFRATFDEEGRARRWVQRVFVTKDLRAFSDWDAPQERVYAPRFEVASSTAAA